MSEELKLKIEHVLSDSELDENVRDLVRQLVQRNEELTSEVKEYTTVFDFSWNADRRAQRMWEEAHPDQPLVWPDKADMIVWLLERDFQSRKELAIEKQRNKEFRDSVLEELTKIFEHVHDSQDKDDVSQLIKKCEYIDKKSDDSIFETMEYPSAPEEIWLNIAGYDPGPEWDVYWHDKPENPESSVCYVRKKNNDFPASAKATDVDTMKDSARKLAKSMVADGTYENWKMKQKVFKTGKRNR